MKNTTKKITMTMVACAMALSLTACKNDIISTKENEAKAQDATAQIVEVTNKNGEVVTNIDGTAVTEIVKGNVTTTTKATETTKEETVASTTKATTKKVATTIKNNETTTKAITKATTQATTSPVVTTTAPVNPYGYTNAWGTLEQMEVDCKAYVQSLGATYCDNWNLDEGCWETPVMSSGWMGSVSADDFKADIKERIVACMNCAGLKKIKVVFVTNDNYKDGRSGNCIDVTSYYLHGNENTVFAYVVYQ